MNPITIHRSPFTRLIAALVALAAVYFLPGSAFAQTADVKFNPNTNALVFPAATDFRNNNGLQIGVNIQAYDADLAAISALSPTKGNLLVGNGTAWVALTIGTNDHVLTADSAQSSGVKWAAASGGAPASAQYLVLANNGSLTDERAVSFGTGFEIYDDAATPSATLTIELDADLVDLVDGSLTGSKVGSGINAANITTGDLALSNLAQGSALSVLGVTGNATADNASIAAGSDHQVLRRSGTSVAFGQINLASSNAVTGALALANGGTGLAELPKFIANKSSDQTLTAGSWAKITFTTEILDEGSDYASSTWTPGVAGKARLSVRLRFTWGSAPGQVYFNFRKNGSEDTASRYVFGQNLTASSGFLHFVGTALVEANGTDTWDLWAYSEFADLTIAGGQNQSNSDGHMVP